jgi:hypothetical protein
MYQPGGTTEVNRSEDKFLKESRYRGGTTVRFSVADALASGKDSVSCLCSSASEITDSQDEESPKRRHFSCGETTDGQRTIKAMVRGRLSKMDAREAPELGSSCSSLLLRREHFLDDFSFATSRRASRRFSIGECTHANLSVKGAVQKRTRIQENWAEDRSTRIASKLILEPNSSLATRRLMGRE